MTCGDDFRCAPTTCEQGFECATGHECAPDAMGADVRGCVAVPCQQDGYCAPDWTCDPGNDMADSRGCVHKNCNLHGFPCPEGTLCETGNEVGAGCVIVHCTSDEDCDTNLSCDPEAPGLGCVPRACSTDADCDCGYCVMEQCRPHLYECQFLAP